jgi:apolipoprotein N-acyltransferase
MVTAEIASISERAKATAPRKASPAKSVFIQPEWLVGALIVGCVVGWSAPGMEQWYLAWFGLAPLFWACLSTKSPMRSAVLGTIFGFGFNLVYLQWYLQVRDTAWMAVFSLNPQASCLFAWVTMALLQGLFIGAFCWVLRALPFCASFLPQRGRLPLFTVAPLLWVGLIEKLANHPGLLGVPWSMLEYTQYHQPIIIQAASLIGGSGIACAIVLCNLLLASLAMPAALSIPAKPLKIANLVVGALLLLAIPVYGDARLSEASTSTPTVAVAALQANLAPEVHKVSTVSTIERYLSLSLSSRAEICIFPEWSVPINWTTQQDFVTFFAGQAKINKQIWLLGAFDTAGGANKYNAVGAIDSDGTVYKEAYHKKYLVPFGEYVPGWIYNTPLMSVFDPKHQTRNVITSGDRSLVLRTSKAKIAPMICFENCLPALSATSVRDGADLLVDCSNTTWFKYSNVLGKQLVAFSVMRAVENHRSFVFCTVLGPSAVIDPNGRIVQQAHIDQPIALEAKVPLETDITLFNRMCRF